MGGRAGAPGIVGGHRNGAGLGSQSIEVPQGGHWIDYPPTGATPPSLYPATDRLVLGIAGKPGDKRPVFRAALQ
jgi:hypothetical protein